MSDGNTDEAPNESPATIAEVSITGPGIAITRSVDEARMASIISLLFGVQPAGEGGGGRGAAGGASAGTGSGSGDGGGAVGGGGQQPLQWDEDLTLGEFIMETGAKTFQHKICAAGYYLMRFQGADSFNRDEARMALADAHEDMPGNFARDFGDAAAKNLIAGKQGDPGRFIIPRTGRTAVESRFQELPKRRPARKATKKSSARGDAE